MKLKNLIPEKARAKILKGAVNTLFQIHKRVYFPKNINYPKTQCIFALWHCHQCGIYSIVDRRNSCVMISRSKDGDMIAYATKHLGFKVVRGSKTRGGAAATLELVEHMKNGANAIITIDGPRGPKYIVKKGAIEIARMTGVPVVPMVYWAGKNGFFKFNSWDEFCYPVPFKKIINIYGDPIYVPNDADDNKIEEIRLKVEEELKRLFEKAQKEYKSLLKA